MNYFPKFNIKEKETLRVEHQKGMIRNSIEWFLREMQEELLKHLDRPGWKREKWEYLLGRLEEETEELKTALASFHTLRGESGEYFKKKKQIVKECADVANFAMMIAHNHF